MPRETKRKTSGFLLSNPFPEPSCCLSSFFSSLPHKIGHLTDDRDCHISHERGRLFLAKFVLAASGVSSGMGVWWALWVADQDMAQPVTFSQTSAFLVGQMEVVGRIESAPLGKHPAG